MHYSDSLNGFWVMRNVMRPGLVALAAQGLVLGKWVRPVGHNVKLVSKVQGPNGSGGLVPYSGALKVP